MRIGFNCFAILMAAMAIVIVEVSAQEFECGEVMRFIGRNMAQSNAPRDFMLARGILGEIMSGRRDFNFSNFNWTMPRQILRIMTTSTPNTNTANTITFANNATQNGFSDWRRLLFNVTNATLPFMPLPPGQIMKWDGRVPPLNGTGFNGTSFNMTWPDRGRPSGPMCNCSVVTNIGQLVFGSNFTTMLLNTTYSVCAASVQTSSEPMHTGSLNLIGTFVIISVVFNRKYLL